MKKLFLSIAVAAFAVSAFAQESTSKFDTETGTFEQISKRGPYLTNRLFDNMFVGVAGGVNYSMTKNDGDAGFGDRIAPALDISLGKWITPAVGLRLQYSGLSAKGASPAPTGYTSGGRIDGKYYAKEFNMMNFHGDILWNISNSIGGYKETRFWDFVPFIGAGVAHGSAKEGDAKTNEFGISAGLLNIIRLGGVVDLTLEARGLATRADFDGYATTSRKPDLLGSVTAGLSFNLGPKGFKRSLATAPADYTPYRERISALESDLAGANDRISRLQRQLDECNNRPAPIPATVTVATTMAAFFKIGSAQIAETDMVNIQNIANIIKNSDQTYNVLGFADAGTGSVKLNQELSTKRAQNVAAALEKLGVDASKLNVEGKGGVSTSKNPNIDRMVRVEPR